jgi:replication-associated recombination protein RarA
MPADRPDLRAADGTELGVAVSALTKCLRRELELEACYWAMQLEPSFAKYLWRRLGIFAAEDVGLANPGAAVVVEALRSTYELTRKESKAQPDGSLIGLAVLVLARSPKNREAAELFNVAAQMIDEGWKPEVPESAWDMHTSQGRQSMNRKERQRHWFEQASVASPACGPRDWLLASRRRAAKQGVLDPSQVEEEAIEWNQQELLRFGSEGWQP